MYEERLTSIEPKNQGPLGRVASRLREPVEESPAVLFVHHNIAGKLQEGDWWLPGKSRDLITSLFISHGSSRQKQEERQDEQEKQRGEASPHCEKNELLTQFPVCGYISEYSIWINWKEKRPIYSERKEDKMLKDLNA